MSSTVVSWSSFVTIVKLVEEVVSVGGPNSIVAVSYKLDTGRECAIGGGGRSPSSVSNASSLDVVVIAS